MKNRQHIIEQFSAFIATLPQVESEPETADQTIDLFSLFEVLCVLKNEVKTESRQVKTALDEFKAVFASLNQHQDYLQQTIDSQQQVNKQLNQQLNQQNHQLLKPLLLSLIELFDDLDIALNANNEPQPTGWLSRFKLPLWQKLQTVKQGQQMTLRQLQKVLTEYQVQSINSIGQPYDPTLMKVVATTSQSSIDNNIVVEEQLKGFLWQDQLLRLAEVKVNKTSIVNKQEQNNE